MEMKNNKRPLAVDRLGVRLKSKYHYLTGLRGWNSEWVKHPFYDEHNHFIIKQNELNDDNN